MPSLAQNTSAISGCIPGQYSKKAPLDTRCVLTLTQISELCWLLILGLVDFWFELSLFSECPLFMYMYYFFPLHGGS